jgi:Predicted xylanase/chitin deacetylase
MVVQTDSVPTAEHAARATVSAWTPPESLTARHIPRVSGSFENVVTPARELWGPCHLVPGVRYRVRALISGTAETGDNAAILRLPGAEGGENLRTESPAGPYMYLRTGPGLHRTDRTFTVNAPVTRFGLRKWGNRGDSVVRALTVEALDPRPPTDFFLTFDVEALTIRADRDHIDRLVWGRVDGREYGLRRLCDILDQYGLRGVFFLDVASITRDGDGPAREIVDFLRSRGHELQMHLHPEELARQWGFHVEEGFDGFSYETTKRLLDFTMTTFERITGERGRVFRSAGTRFNVELLLAAQALGIEALSNVRGPVVGVAGLGGDPQDVHELFRWDAGPIEIPIDYSAELYRPFARYEAAYDRAVSRKSYAPTFDILFHSWSLAAENEQGLRQIYRPDYEEAFHQICAHVRDNGRTRTLNEYLDEISVERVVRTSMILATAAKEDAAARRGDSFTKNADLVHCTVCDQRVGPARIVDGRCPVCGAGPAQRQLRYVLDQYDTVFHGRRVAAAGAAQLSAWGLLAGAASVHDVTEADLIGIDGVVVMGDGSVALAEAAEQAARLLPPGGIFVATAPAAVGPGDGDTTAQERVAAYEKLLSQWFTVTSVPAHDRVTDVVSRVYVGLRR